jgi:hypothetical protein
MAIDLRVPFNTLNFLISWAAIISLRMTLFQTADRATRRHLPTHNNTLRCTELNGGGERDPVPWWSNIQTTAKSCASFSFPVLTIWIYSFEIAWNDEHRPINFSGLLQQSRTEVKVNFLLRLYANPPSFRNAHAFGHLRFLSARQEHQPLCDMAWSTAWQYLVF